MTDARSGGMTKTKPDCLSASLLGYKNGLSVVISRHVSLVFSDQFIIAHSQSVIIEINDTTPSPDIVILQLENCCMSSRIS